MEIDVWNKIVDAIMFITFFTKSFYEYKPVYSSILVCNCFFSKDMIQLLGQANYKSIR